MSDINKYNPNDEQRNLIVYASNTIGFLASVIAKVSNGARIDLILSDMEDADYHYEKLKQVLKERK